MGTVRRHAKSLRKVGRRILIWLLNELENIVTVDRAIREKAIYRGLLVCEDLGNRVQLCED